ncbi:xanthine dehydrogenase family protein molybdopterin-binding subunit [Oscillibacter sp. GMB15532]|uniref:xanthine dehydrogenase family protein molybdopterin-binding subunit n=1 Tax=Oscillibacter sp. GMB15532 TaxID=3230022 RepID=UPI0034DFAC8C
MGKPFQVLNHAIPRLESMEKATGKIAYTADLDAHGAAAAIVLRSPHSCARVLQIDCSEAEKVPGFLGCLLPCEVPDILYNPSGNPPAELLLADARILTENPRYIGDRIVCVAAETDEACRMAAQKVKIRYEVHAPLLTLKDAMAEGARPIQPHLSASNIVKRRNVSQGSPDQKGEVLLSGHFSTPSMQHVPIEPTCCICDFSDGKNLTVYSNSQTVFQERRIVSELLGLKENDVRFIKPAVGGGFGARQQLHSQPVIALMSKKLGRPVRLVYTREEEFTATAVRLGTEIDIEVGANRDGVLQYLSAYYLANIGPYTIHGPTIVAGASRKIQYRIPNYFFDGYSILTNDICGGAFRGYGNTQLTFGREIMLDRMAQKLGMDPLEFRLKNHVKVGEHFPCVDAPVTSCAIEECARRAMEIRTRIDVEEHLTFDEEVRQAWGVAFACHGSGPSSREGLSSAIVMLNDDGTARILVGSADIGQGSETMLSQIAAETLGLSLSDVRIKAADTLLTPYDTGTFASSQTFVCGNAVALACRDARAKLLKQLMETVPEAVVTEEDDGFLISSGDKREHLSVQQAVRRVAFHQHGGVIIGCGSYKAQASPSPFVVCMAKVEYRPKLNTVRLLHIIEAADVGTPINRLSVEGQLEGGIAQGVGYALFERMERNPRAQKTVSTDLLHYRVPQAADMPKTHVVIADSYEPTGPHGAKSVGEVATVPVAPAIVNAVNRAAGTEIGTLPLCDRFVILPHSAERGPLS